MLTEKLAQGFIFILCFLSWDFYLKETFYSFIVPEGEEVGLAEVAMGYGIIFVVAFVLSKIVAMRLSSDEEASEY